MKCYEHKPSFAPRIFLLSGFAFQGFSVIELMVVVAMIAALSAIAIPTYKSYMYKSKISEAVDYAANASKAANDYLSESGAVIPTGAFPAAPGLCATMPGVATANNINSADTASWIIAVSCIVTVNTTAAAGGGSAATITMTPTGNSDGSIAWACTTNSPVYGAGTCQ